MAGTVTAAAMICAAIIAASGHDDWAWFIFITLIGMLYKGID